MIRPMLQQAVQTGADSIFPERPYCHPYRIPWWGNRILMTNRRKTR
ncbi:MAG: hypothetical protein VYE64_06195 [Planctomycetota bacterium]|nr:hypothetical protein [Planctomycetota bacterium]